jgi:hypothetical protein
MPDTLEERDWQILISRISDGRCTPFLGAGASFPALPLGSQIAHEWAQKYRYPLEDSRNLARVAQYLAVEYDPLFPKEEFVRLVQTSPPPNFQEQDEPHAMLAELPLAVYMTTNYDDFMLQALNRRLRDARQEMCRWNTIIQDLPSLFGPGSSYGPTPANPLVFHLHGHSPVSESLVLTEDDYLDFLVNVSGEGDGLPGPVKQALAADSLLFIGYALADWNFRVILRGLRLRGRLSIAVLTPPTGPEPSQEKAQMYLTHYYQQIEDMDLRIYWGTAREFTADLRQRWEAAGHQSRS